MALRHCSAGTEFGGAITHVDGHVTSSRVSPEIAAQGVLFGGLQELLESHRELLEPYFMKRARACGCGSVCGVACGVLDQWHGVVCASQR